MNRLAIVLVLMLGLPAAAACERDATKADDATLREFAVFSYRDIAADLIDGNGPYLDTLLAVFADSCSDRATLISNFRDIIASSASAPDFARRLSAAHATSSPQK